jgi:hypothetical protein
MSLQQLEEAHSRAIDLGAEATRVKLVQEVVRRTTAKLRVTDEVLHRSAA